jgi:hypothetical protein
MAETVDHALSPGELAAALARFVDALLPGDGLFPAASATGAHGVLGDRLRETVGAAAPALLASAFISRGGFTDGAGAAAALAAAEPRMFDAAQTILTYAYYQSPAAIAAIRALGYSYNDAPQPNGYSMRPFDPAIDAPAAGRGSYVRTKDVRRVDLSGLDFLNGAVR